MRGELGQTIRGRLVEVSVWGWRGRVVLEGGASFRVRVNEERTALDAACAYLERRARLRVLTVSPQGTSLLHGEPEARHYQVTLGHAAGRRPGDGFSVDASCWLAVPADEPEGHIGFGGRP